MKPQGLGFSQHPCQVGAHREQGLPGMWAEQGCRQALELVVLSSNLCSSTFLQGDLSEPQFPPLLNGNNQATQFNIGLPSGLNDLMPETISSGLSLLGPRHSGAMNPSLASIEFAVIPVWGQEGREQDYCRLKSAIPSSTQ